MDIKRKKIRNELYWIWFGEAVCFAAVFYQSFAVLVIGLTICLTAIIFWIGD